MTISPSWAPDPGLDLLGFSVAGFGLPADLATQPSLAAGERVASGEHLHLEAVTCTFRSWRGTRTPNLLFTRQLTIVHSVLASAVLAGQVRWVVQPVLFCPAEYAVVE
jgi:hypothetical protein